jgi:hypothetical protein
MFNLRKIKSITRNSTHQAPQPQMQPQPQVQTQSEVPQMSNPAENIPQAENVTQVNYAIEKITDNNVMTETLTPAVSIATNDGDKELYRLKSFWLLDLFPNELVIREKSLHIISRDFLQSQVETMLIQDISFVTVSQGVFFASLVVSYRIPHDDFQIDKLSKSQATQAKAILDSLIIAKQAKSEKVEIFEQPSVPGASNH